MCFALDLCPTPGDSYSRLKSSPELQGPKPVQILSPNIWRKKRTQRLRPQGKEEKLGTGLLRTGYTCTLAPNVRVGKFSQTPGSPQPGHLKGKPRHGACS